MVLCIPVQLQAVQYTDHAEDSLLLASELDSLAHYKAKMGPQREDLDAYNSFLEKLLDYYFFDSVLHYAALDHARIAASGTSIQRSAFTYSWGKALRENNLYDSAKVVLDRILLNPELQASVHYLGLAQLEMGVTFRLQGEVYNAEKYIRESLQSFSEAGDTLNYLDAQMQLGIVLMLQSQEARAEAIFQALLQTSRKRGDWRHESFALSILSIQRTRQRRYKEGLAIAAKSLALRFEHRDVRNQGESLNNLGINQLGNGDPDLARQYLREALFKLLLGRDSTFESTILSNIAYSYLMQDSLDRAEAHFQMALQSALERDQKSNQVGVYGRLSGICRDRGDFQCAYEYLKLRRKVEQEILAEEEELRYADLESKFKDQERRQQLAYLERENEILNDQNLLVTGFSIFALVLLTALFVLYRTRTRQGRRLLEQEKELLQSRQQATAQELKAVEERLASNRLRLEDFVVNLKEKNELIVGLRSKIGELESQVGEGENEKQEIKSRLEQMRILTHEDWTVFLRLFRNAYPQVIERLQQLHPDLSRGEIRMFLLMRLNLENQDIAEMLGVSREAVKKGIYRLRKKLELPDIEDLRRYILEFQ